MSAARLVAAIQRHSTASQRNVAQSAWGFVSSVDPTRPAAKVLLQPANVLTGWLPIILAGAGSSFTLTVIPEVGWQAFLLPENGSPNDYVIVGFAHSDRAPLPVVPNTNGTGGSPNTVGSPASAGEVLLLGQGGSVLRFTAAGDIYAKPGSGNFLVDGSILANGDVSDRHGSLDRLRGNHNAHRHGNVQNGGGTSAISDRIDPE